MHMQPEIHDCSPTCIYTLAAVILHGDSISLPHYDGLLVDHRWYMYHFIIMYMYIPLCHMDPKLYIHVCVHVVFIPFSI